MEQEEEEDNEIYSIIHEEEEEEEEEESNIMEIETGKKIKKGIGTELPILKDIIDTDLHKTDTILYACIRNFKKIQFDTYQKKKEVFQGDIRQGKSLPDPREIYYDTDKCYSRITEYFRLASRNRIGKSAITSTRMIFNKVFLDNPDLFIMICFIYNEIFIKNTDQIVSFSKKSNITENQEILRQRVNEITERYIIKQFHIYNDTIKDEEKEKREDESENIELNAMLLLSTLKFIVNKHHTGRLDELFSLMNTEIRVIETQFDYTGYDYENGNISYYDNKYEPSDKGSGNDMPFIRYKEETMIKKNIIDRPTKKSFQYKKEVKTMLLLYLELKQLKHFDYMMNKFIRYSSSDIVTIEQLNTILYALTSDLYHREESLLTYKFHSLYDFCYILCEQHRRFGNIKEYILLLDSCETVELFDTVIINSNSYREISLFAPFNTPINELINKFFRYNESISIMIGPWFFNIIQWINFIARIPFNTESNILMGKLNLISRFKWLKSIGNLSDINKTKLVILEQDEVNIRENSIILERYTLSLRHYYTQLILRYHSILRKNTYIHYFVHDILYPKYTRLIWSRIIQLMKQRIGINQQQPINVEDYNRFVSILTKMYRLPFSIKFPTVEHDIINENFIVIPNSPSILLYYTDQDLIDIFINIRSLLQTEFANMFTTGFSFNPSNWSLYTIEQLINSSLMDDNGLNLSIFREDIKVLLYCRVLDQIIVRLETDDNLRMISELLYIMTCRKDLDFMGVLRNDGLCIDYDIINAIESHTETFSLNGKMIISLINMEEEEEGGIIGINYNTLSQQQYLWFSDIIKDNIQQIQYNPSLLSTLTSKIFTNSHSLLSDMIKYKDLSILSSIKHYYYPIHRNTVNIKKKSKPFHTIRKLKKSLSDILQYNLLILRIPMKKKGNESSNPYNDYFILNDIIEYDRLLITGKDSVIDNLFLISTRRSSIDSSKEFITKCDFNNEKWYDQLEEKGITKSVQIIIENRVRYSSSSQQQNYMILTEPLDYPDLSSNINDFINGKENTINILGIDTNKLNVVSFIPIIIGKPPLHNVIIIISLESKNNDIRCNDWGSYQFDRLDFALSNYFYQYKPSIIKKNKEKVWIEENENKEKEQENKEKENTRKINERHKAKQLLPKTPSQEAKDTRRKNKKEKLIKFDAFIKLKIKHRIENIEEEEEEEEEVIEEGLTKLKLMREQTASIRQKYNELLKKHKHDLLDINMQEELMEQAKNDYFLIDNNKFSDDQAKKYNDLLDYYRNNMDKNLFEGNETTLKIKKELVSLIRRPSIHGLKKFKPRSLLIINESNAENNEFTLKIYSKLKRYYMEKHIEQNKLPESKIKEFTLRSKILTPYALIIYKKLFAKYMVNNHITHKKDVDGMVIIDLIERSVNQVEYELEIRNMFIDQYMEQHKNTKDIPGKKQDEIEEEAHRIANEKMGDYEKEVVIQEGEEEGGGFTIESITNNLSLLDKLETIEDIEENAINDDNIDTANDCRQIENGILSQNNVNDDNGNDFLIQYDDISNMFQSSQGFTAFL